MQAAGTITARTAAGRKFAAFGSHSLMTFPTGTIYGEQWIEVGDRTMFAEQASVCAGMGPGHDLGPGSVLRIGSGCVIGRGSHIVAHHSIDIGDDVYTGPYVYITDQNHTYSDPEVPIGRQWPVNAPVRIGSGSWLGTGVIVLPGSVIGRNVVVAAGSVVTGEISDQCVVAGVPARVVKRYSPETGWSRHKGPRSLDDRQHAVHAGSTETVPNGAMPAGQAGAGLGGLASQRLADGALGAADPVEQAEAALVAAADGALADQADQPEAAAALVAAADGALADRTDQPQDAGAALAAEGQI